MDLDGVASEAKQALESLIEASTTRLTAEVRAGSARRQRLVVGGGFAATTTHVTSGIANDQSLLLADAWEPWGAMHDWPMGQPAAELVSEAFVRQPESFSPANNPFCSAAAFSAALQVTQAHHAVPLCRAAVSAVSHAGGDFAISFPGGTAIAPQLDIANGRGPFARLSDSKLSPELDAELRRDGRLAYGDGRELDTFAPRGDVLVIGGGATAAWFVERGARSGAKVVWLAERRDPGLWEDALAKRLQRLEELCRSPPRSLDVGRLRRWIERLSAFRAADVPRNRAAFRANNVTRTIGSVREIKSLGTRIEVAWDNPSGAQTFDHIVIAIGQMPTAETGPEGLAHPVRGRRLLCRNTLTGSVRCLSSAELGDDLSEERIIGVANTTVTFRVLGAAAAYPWRLVRMDHLERANVQTHLELKQLRCAPKHSRGIAGSIYQASIDIALANKTPLQAALGAARLNHANLSPE